jgi:DNA-binding transcriptional LysR family regulator
MRARGGVLGCAHDSSRGSGCSGVASRRMRGPPSRGAPRSCCNSSLFKRGAQLHEIQVDFQIGVGHAESLVDAAIAGAGIIYSMDLFVADAIRRGQLVPLLSNWQTPQRPLSVVYPQNRHLSAKVRAFVHFAVETFRALQNEASHAKQRAWGVERTIQSDITRGERPEALCTELFGARRG